MKKETKIILGLAVIVILILVVSMIVTRKKTPNNDITEVQKIVIPTQKVENDYSSDTGAVYISPTQNEYEEIFLIKKLRNSCPINNSAFLIDYSYETNKFVVVIKNNSSSNRKIFNEWLENSGYNKISDIYFSGR